MELVTTYIHVHAYKASRPAQLILAPAYICLWEVEKVVCLVHKEYLQSSSGHVVPS